MANNTTEKIKRDTKQILTKINLYILSALETWSGTRTMGLSHNQQKLKINTKMGPAEINEFEEYNVHILLPSGKSKVIIIMHPKKFFAPHTSSNDQEKILSLFVSLSRQHSFFQNKDKNIKKLMELYLLSIYPVAHKVLTVAACE
jgi:hypothetical protein